MYDATPLITYLDARGIPYRVERHPRTTTALETAQVEHRSGRRFAKTVVSVAPGGRLLLAVVPATLRVDLDKLWRLSRRGPLRLASEDEFAGRFPNCEPGAMPPLGRLYNLDVYVDDDLAVAEEVTFNACSHIHTLTLDGKDFLKAVEATVGDISSP
jgi:Ala-tRNA(Pro) deacylase